MSGPVELAAGSKGRWRRRLLRIFIVGLVAAVSVVAGGVDGSIVRIVVSRPPAVLPMVPPGFPNASQRVLPRVTVPDVRKVFESQDHPWACQADTYAGVSGARRRLICSAPYPDYPADAGGSLEFDDDTHVRRVRATCEPMPPAPRDLCGTYFGQVAGALFLKQESLRKPAIDWAVQNADGDTSTTIGGIRVDVKLSPHEIVFTPLG